MLHAVGSFVETLVYNLRAADLLDVLFIAGLLYGLFAWMRHRVSRVVGFGILSVGLVYALAQTLDLYLTSMVFQVGLTIIALALVVVFQDDIRRLFERLRTLSVGDSGGGTIAVRDRQTLVDAAAQLASQRIGALIVLPGRESLDVHLHGGVTAHADVSVPLLMSIFHPKTGGHDGAVIIDDGKVERFAVHLPLSTRTAKLGPGGTRHAAALGLAERCDAFVIVVSEERGIISVAHEGELVALASPEELSRHIERFGRAERAERAERAAGGARRWPRWLAHDVGLKFAAVGLASLMWLLFAYRVETVQRSYEVPIEYRGLASNWYLQDPKPIKARVELNGSERAFDDIDASQLKISVDLNKLEEGPQQIALTESQLNEPAGVSVSDFEPGTLRIKAHKLVKADLPVKAQTKGKVADGYALETVVTEPGRVEVMVPQYLKGFVHELQTEPIDVDGLTRTKTVQATLISSQQVRFEGNEPPKIKVRLEVAPRPAPQRPVTGAGS